MAFRGDPWIFERHTYPEDPYFDMSTTIIRSYGRPGFVIAADGRSMTTDDPPITNNYTQKIFDLTSGDRQIACSIMGASVIVADGSREIILDFGLAILRAAEAISGRRCRNLAGYATRLARPINALLAELKSNGTLIEYPSFPTHFRPYGSAIASVYFDGFFEGVPSRAGVTFSHKNQKLLEPDVITELVVPAKRDIIGPHQITQLVFHTTDPRFSAYRLNRTHSGSLEDEVEACKKYILACSDPEALRIEPKCACIGGHVHAATITPDAGFRWSIPPMQNSSQPSSGVMKPE
jgi:hypothetical protein